jgi:drug/metabolite transporter (DMT)-like permease
VLGIALALASSMCWGVADFVGGLQARRLPLLRLMLITQAIGLTAVAIVLAIRGHAAPGITHLLPAAAGGLGGVIGLTALYRALAIGTMSIAAPIASTGACLPVIVGIAGGERPSALKLAGVAAAIIGVVLVSREPGPGWTGAERHVRISVLLALVAALGFGSFAIGLRESARADALWGLLAGRIAGVSSLTVVFALTRPPAAENLRASGLPLLAMGILDVAANGLYAIATRHGLLSIVAVLSSLYPLATVVLARVLLGERIHRVQELGIAAALAGVGMIAAG